MHRFLVTRISQFFFVVGCSLLLIISPLATSRASAADIHDEHPWINPSLSPDHRADLLIAQMTLDEKISMLHGADYSKGQAGYVGHIPANTRLGIPALNLEDGPAGVADGVSQVTAFPAPVAGAASWDSTLMNQYGQVLGTEAASKGANVLLAPTVNILRNPQWGRSFESLGEDPYLTSQMGVADIQGIQSQNVIATVKHLAANSQEINRTSINANVDERTLQEIYLPAFEAAVEQGHVGAVMCSYNRVNGPFACEQPDLMNGALNTQANFKGFVMSDWGATHNTVPSVMAGLDMQMPDGSFYGAALKAAVKNGQVSMNTINGMVHRILRTMFASGFFDHPNTGNLNNNVATAAHAQFALQEAEQGTVLLQNNQNILPLNSSTIKSIAVIGADASTSPMVVGEGSASVNTSYVVTPLQGITSRASSNISVQYADGSNQKQTIRTAQAADVAIVFANDVESEGSDRSNLSLPNNQDQLIKTVAQANPHTIVVLNTGAPVLMPWVNQVQGIVEAWYPGQEDGNAIAAVLFGDINPSGKLPMTFPASASDVPANTPQQYPGINGQETYSEGVFVGYRYYDANNITPLFPFGYGLSYTSFAYNNLSVTPRVASYNDTLHVSLDVTNTGKHAGAEVVQLYLGIPSTNVPEPPKQLKGFQKVYLNPGQTKHVTFSLDPQNLSYWDVNAHGWVVQKGTYKVMVGSSSRDIALSSNVLVPVTNGPLYITAKAPGVVMPGSTSTVTTSFADGSDFAASNVQLNLQAPSDWLMQPLSNPSFPLVQPGQIVQTQWRVTVLTNAQPGNTTLTTQARYMSRDGPDQRQNTATVILPYSLLQQAYNNVGSSDDSNPAVGNFDGGGYSYSTQALASVGLTAGATITHNGISFIWPDVVAGLPNNVMVNDQMLLYSGSGSTLGFLGAGASGTQSGSVTITYTDGSTQQFILTFADWYANSATPGTDLLATAPYWNVPASDMLGSHAVSVYFASVPLQADKTMQSINLPINDNLHVFALSST